jgi:hypothetical protein
MTAGSSIVAGLPQSQCHVAAIYDDNSGFGAESPHIVLDHACETKWLVIPIQQASGKFRLSIEELRGFVNPIAYAGCISGWG